MAAGGVRDAIAAILEDRDFDLNTPRIPLEKATAKKLLKSASDNHSHNEFYCEL